MDRRFRPRKIRFFLRQPIDRTSIERQGIVNFTTRLTAEILQTENHRKRFIFGEHPFHV
jgi:hypothetical protein